MAETAVECRSGGGFVGAHLLTPAPARGVLATRSRGLIARRRLGPLGRQAGLKNSSRAHISRVAGSGFLGPIRTASPRPGPPGTRERMTPL